MADYLCAHGTIDPAEARHQAVIDIGNTVHTQSLTMGFSDTFEILGTWYSWPPSLS
ncbi:MAG: hypothetical protein J2P54_04315 [Bradyrhizobiaceae bacterium]|nr:hypothetical protein [Bradyrhizobiaceae bacterium]